ncbi:MAG: hypothetical protein IPK32_13805 [Verrucomicrobiaceae bacterium]|nr:hypothetical protein [Verrucomicrobiaceae bacterium]
MDSWKLILRNKKLTGLILFVCLLFTFAWLVQALIRAKNAQTPNAWIQQANNMRQVGIILCSYLENHKGEMPHSIAELKEWSVNQSDFKDSIYSPIWQFADPSTQKVFQWQLALKKNLYPLYAPVTCQNDERYKSKRLVLIKCEKGQVSYGFVDEIIFQNEVR